MIARQFDDFVKAILSNSIRVEDAGEQCFARDVPERHRELLPV
jgi:hypothetical protein